MPSIAQSNGSANGTATSRFQLPALDLKLGSLTEGTDIPPPLPSPVQEERDEAPVADKHAASKPTSVTTATQTSPDFLKNALGLNRSPDATPTSPTSTKGPGSLRRLFSRNRLNDAYLANPHAPVGEALSPRPPSQSNASVNTNKQSKRTSGWFRRFRGSDASNSDKRTSRVFFAAPESPKPTTAVAPTEKPTGPPPPKIPEFKALGSKVDISDDAGSLGADLFKDIK